SDLVVDGDVLTLEHDAAGVVLQRAHDGENLDSFPTRRSSDLVGRGKTRAGAAVSDSAGGETPMKMRKLSGVAVVGTVGVLATIRSEEHTSELQSQSNLVCRLLLEKKNREGKMHLEALHAQRSE